MLIRKFAETIADEAIVQTLSALLSRSRNALLPNKATWDNIAKVEVGV